MDKWYRKEHIIIIIIIMAWNILRHSDWLKLLEPGALS